MFGFDMAKMAEMGQIAMQAKELIEATHQKAQDACDAGAATAEMQGEILSAIAGLDERLERVENSLLSSLDKIAPILELAKEEERK